MQLDKAHRYGGDGVEKIIRPLTKVPVLAIDDLGHGKSTENNLACFFDLLDARTSKSLPTHFTTQHDRGSLQHTFAQVNQTTTEAILRRMSDFCIHVPFTEK